MSQLDQVETLPIQQDRMFREFFVEHRPRLTSVLMMAGATRQDADDAAQEAMREVFLKWSNIDFPATYARTVALRTLSHAHKRRKRENDLLTRAASGGAWPNTQPVTELDATSEYVMALLKTLSPEQRTVMALTVDGYSPAEIAEMTGQPAATVRSNLRHARTNLAKRLDLDKIPEARKEVERWTKRCSG